MSERPLALMPMPKLLRLCYDIWDCSVPVRTDGCSCSFSLRAANQHEGWAIVAVLALPLTPDGILHSGANCQLSPRLTTKLL